MPNKKEKNQLKEIAEEVDTFDTMLSALVELLEEKGILTQQEWENRIKQKIEKNQKLMSFREIQFQSKKK
jgi:predicted transcriptional regulator